MLVSDSFREGNTKTQSIQLVTISQQSSNTLHPSVLKLAVIFGKVSSLGSIGMAMHHES